MEGNLVDARRVSILVQSVDVSLHEPANFSGIIDLNALGLLNSALQRFYDARAISNIRDVITIALWSLSASRIS